MREDCNVIDQDEAPMVRISIHACARIATVIGDSCRRSAPFRFMHAQELQQQTSRRANYMSDFDSCMREDCNREGELLPGVDCILIHACARIAIGYWTHLGLGVAYFNSCMCEDCNHGEISEQPGISILIHACARIAIHSARQRYQRGRF